MFTFSLPAINKERSLWCCKHGKYWPSLCTILPFETNIRVESGSTLGVSASSFTTINYTVAEFKRGCSSPKTSFAVVDQTILWLKAVGWKCANSQTRKEFRKDMYIAYWLNICTWESFSQDGCRVWSKNSVERMIQLNVWRRFYVFINMVERWVHYYTFETKEQ